MLRTYDCTANRNVDIQNREKNPYVKGGMVGRRVRYEGLTHAEFICGGGVVVDIKGRLSRRECDQSSEFL